MPERGEPQPAAPLWLRPFDWLGAGVLFALMLLTFVDVAGRYLFDRPVPGGFYWVSVLMALLVFAGLPSVTARDEHLRAGLLDHLFTGRARYWQGPLVLVCMAVGLGVLAWRLWLLGQRFARTNATITTIDVPLAWLSWFGAAMALVALLALVWTVWRRARAWWPAWK